MSQLPCVEEPTLILIALLAAASGFVVGVIYSLILGAVEGRR